MPTIKPNIYIFNPTCEYAIANGNASWQPNNLLHTMESDMASLTLFFATEKDFVIVPQKPLPVFMEQLHALNIKIPAFITIKELSTTSLEQIGELRPWGWSPAMHKLLAPLKENCSLPFKNSPVFQWHENSRNIYSRKFAIEILSQLISNHPSEYFIKKELLPQICTSKKCYEERLKEWDEIMVKAPWSSSGRGLQPVRKAPVHPKVWEKLLGIIKTQGYAIAEPYLNKVADLAFQFRIQKGKISFEGISNFFTDNKGQYAGNSLNGLPNNMDEETTDFIKSLPEIILQPLTTVLEKSKLAKQYEGYFGVDMLIFKDKQSKLKVNPCLEINIRYNMGLLSVILEKYIQPNKKGIFKTFFNPKESFDTFCHKMAPKHPLQIVNHKIASGFFPVSAPEKDSKFGAYILV